MAASTWEGCSAPLAQDEAAEAYTPPRSARNNSASLSMPSKHRWHEPATLADRSTALPVPEAGRTPDSTTPSTVARSPSARRSRSRPTRSTTSARRATVISAAAPMPTMPATFGVPLRRSASCPPPTI